MKNKALVFTLFILSVFSSRVALADGIEFVHDKSLQEMLDMAKAQNKLVFIDCFTTWCGPCKRLSANTFPDPAVGEFFNAAFVNGKVDMEKGEGPTIAGKYGVRAYPTLLWLDGEGNVVHKVVGGVDPTGLIEHGRKATDPTPGLVNNMKVQYKEGKRDMDFLSEFLNAMNSAGEKNDEVFKDYLGRLTPANLSDKKHVQTILNQTNNMQSPGMAYILKNMGGFKNAVGAEGFNAKINQLAAKAVKEAPKADNKKMFEEAIELVKANKAPDSEEHALKLSMEYYQAMGNWEEYDKATTKYIKKYAAKNASLINDAAWNYFLNINNTEQLKKASQWAYEALNIDNKYTYNLTYAYLLYKLNIYKEAEKACDYAIIRANAENVQPTSATALKDAIKKSTSK